MAISAKEAAERTGLSKAGIMKAIRTGKLSASKNVHGEWEIDPAELFRVYPPVTAAYSEPEVHTELVVTESEHLRTQLVLHREIIEKQEETIRELRAQIEVQNKVTLQLTDSQHQPVRVSWWQRLLGKQG